MSENTSARKQAALNFMKFARAGNRAGVEALLAPDAKHHSAYFAAGMPTLLDAMMAANKAVPNRTADIKLVVEGDDHVIVHSHVKREPTDLGTSVVHIFRFEGDYIAELWDVGQAVPAELPNADGMF